MLQEGGGGEMSGQTNDKGGTIIGKEKEGRKEIPSSRLASSYLLTR